ncbi:TlpA family protein disulfide reductase [Streptacidiphilus sp. ASG 303]|uniref:TlpA family protein disulfide reductase n=1 Tax=Streptacidiphilus sp. ASG 303 TaxID=2896847 RepID=UPI001E4469FE|nr:TlpA disulfide reductase family protein [Streptacidiphilus sp. ASG 303]MCD0485288.1 TlpA family protein disulfide reductase [Streptacidiphilus sp. ASG 303]
MSPVRPASRRTRARLAALAGAAVLAAAGCSASGSGVGDTAGAGFVSGKGGIDTVAAGHRQAAPDISGETVDGGHAALSDYRGKVVVVNVWGSWCSPCRAEAAGLQQTWAAYKDKGVQFLGINTRDTSADNARVFEKNFGVTYPSLYDPDGTQVLRFPKGTLNPQAIPSTLVVDRDGRIAARALKPLAREDVEAMLKPVVAEKP